MVDEEIVWNDEVMMNEQIVDTIDDERRLASTYTLLIISYSLPLVHLGMIKL